MATKEQTQGATTTEAPRPSWPHFLPDGRHALVTIPTGTIAVDVEAKTAKPVFKGLLARFVPTGHLIYLADDRRVRVVPFDAKKLEVTGAEAPVLDNVFRGAGNGAGFSGFCRRELLAHRGDPDNRR